MLILKSLSSRLILNMNILGTRHIYSWRFHYVQVNTLLLSDCGHISIQLFYTKGLNANIYEENILLPPAQAFNTDL